MWCRPMWCPADVVPGASRGGMPSGTASESRPPPNALGCSMAPGHAPRDGTGRCGLRHASRGAVPETRVMHRAAWPVDTAKYGCGMPPSSLTALTAHGWRPRRPVCDRGVSARNSRSCGQRLMQVTAPKARLSVVPGAIRGVMPSGMASESLARPTMWCPAQAGVGCPARRHRSHSHGRRCGVRRKPGWDAQRDGIGVTRTADDVVPGASRGGMPSGAASESRPPSNALGCSPCRPLPTREPPGTRCQPDPPRTDLQ
jgi:hypothetical protein